VKNQAGLRVKCVALDAYREQVVIVHRDCTAFRIEGFQSLARIEVRTANRRLTAVLLIADDTSIVALDEVGLSRHALALLDARPGDAVEIHPPQPIRSLGAVRRKIAGETLRAADYLHIVEDIVSGQYSRTELTAFVVACGTDELERDEVVHLTRAMEGVGRSIQWNRPLVVDKHSIGGIPGNRTSMIVVPIVAAHGLVIPKTSSRAITSPAGTADTMECLARVDFTVREMRGLIETTGACICWGGAMDLSPADDIIISVERPLALDAEGQMVASILSKKLSAGSTHVLIDVPVGPTAKIQSRRRAQSLRKLFRYVAQAFGIHVEVMVTDGSQAIGRGIGPALEARDVLQVLRCDADAPRDLREKSLALAGRVLEFDPDVDWGTGYDLARTILDSGRAQDAMERIIEGQGRNPLPAPGGMVHEWRSPRAGRVHALDNYSLARVARLAGAPLAKGAGVDLLVRVDDVVSEDQPLLRIHAERDADLGFALEYLDEHPATVHVG
jgi:thymidine phosphorylase